MYYLINFIVFLVTFFLFSNYADIAILLLAFYLILQKNFSFFSVPTFLLLFFAFLYEYFYNFSNPFISAPKILLISIFVIFIKYFIQFILARFIRNKNKYLF
jgi:hypothetical protein